MTPLQLQLQLATRMISQGIDEKLVVESLVSVLSETYNILPDTTPRRMVCRNTFIRDINFNDEPAWHEEK
jgi:hypothetical protein